MKIAIMQPGYIPWLGFFDLIKRTDTFIIYSEVQYTKNDWRNRNQIKGPNGKHWITIPVKAEKKPIREIKITDDSWKKSHLKSIEANYGKSEYFYDVYSFLLKAIWRNDENFSSYICNIIKEICEYMELRYDRSVSLCFGDLKLSKTDRLISICKELGANEYLSPNGAKPYLDVQAMNDAGISVEWQNYKHPVYPQLWGDFIPNMSIIDLLFNCGKKSKDII